MALPRRPIHRLRFSALPFFEMIRRSLIALVNHLIAQQPRLGERLANHAGSKVVMQSPPFQIGRAHV